MVAVSETDQAAQSPANAFLESARAQHFAPLWTVLHQMVPPRPNPRAVATLWKYDEMRPCLMEAGRIIGAEEAERRVLMLVNSAMGTYASMISGGTRH